jgi:hypothetical protein
VNKARLMEVLNNTTCLISNGVRTQRKMPGVPILLWGLLLTTVDADAKKLQQVDCHFITVGVNQEQAESHRQAFIDLLEEFPDVQKLSDGPSYKHIASVVGDEMTAFRIFGLGQTLGLWEVMLPSQFGVDPELVDEAAELGLITTTGYESQFPDKAVATG